MTAGCQRCQFRRGVYPFLRVWLITVSPLRRVTFSRRRKSNQKGLLLRSARSLGLGVPSLRDRSGRSASGLLRCTSSRCVWLRQTVATLPPPDQSLHSAFRCRPWIKIKIKSDSRACAHPGVGRHAPRAGCTYLPCRSCRRLRSFDLAFALLFCGSWLASDGGLTADQSPVGVLGSTVGAGLLAKRSVQSADYVELFNSVPNNQNLPTRFSGCPSEARSLVFGCRCKFSDRVWKPDSSKNNAPAP